MALRNKSCLGFECRPSSLVVKRFPKVACAWLQVAGEHVSGFISLAIKNQNPSYDQDGSLGTWGFPCRAGRRMVCFYRGRFLSIPVSRWPSTEDSGGRFPRAPPGAPYFGLRVLGGPAAVCGASPCLCAAGTQLTVQSRTPATTRGTEPLPAGTSYPLLGWAPPSADSWFHLWK